MSGVTLGQRQVLSLLGCLLYLLDIYLDDLI
jgi:hypothetical protein